jgi:hypothetical protein
MNQENILETKKTQNIDDLQDPQESYFEPELVYESDKKALLLENGQCGVCQRKGFPLFLVRKSIVPIRFYHNIDWSKGMVELGDREPKESWKEYKYVYRMLREGYVYILCNPIGNTDDSKLEVMVYEVTYSGAMRLRKFRDVKGSRPKEIPESCLKDNHNIKGLFITIDNRVYDKAWIAYSPIRWKVKTINHYRKNKIERLQRFSEVDLTQTKAPDISPQNRSFLFNDFMDKKRHLLELECDDRMVHDYFDETGRKKEKSRQPKKAKEKLDEIISLIGSMSKGIFKKLDVSLDGLFRYTLELLQEVNVQQFFTASHFNSLILEKSFEALNNTLQSYQSNSHYLTEIAALVVEDSLGIAEELSIQRRQKLAPVAEGLASQNIKDNSDVVELKKYHQLVRSSSHDLIYEKEKHLTAHPLARAMQKARGRNELANYYSEQTQLVKEYPFVYFKPELNYTRRQYQLIEQYKDSIRSSISQECENEAYLFLFYNSKENYNAPSQYPRYRVGSADENITHYIKKNDEINTYDKEQKTIDELSDIDKISVRGVIGDIPLAKKLGIAEDDVYNLWQFNRRVYCRRISVLGLENRISKKRGLGNYKEIPLTPVQQAELLEKYKANIGKKANRYKNIDSVKVVHFYDLQQVKQYYADERLEDDWSKRAKRLNQPSLDNYETFEKTGYQSLYHYIETCSQDYYNYLIWLFGEDHKYYQVESSPASKGSAQNGEPKAALPSTVNKLLFWQAEIEPDISDMHLSFLNSFLVIFDSACLGTITLPQHSALWGMLLNNDQSIYFYLLGDKTKINEKEGTTQSTTPLVFKYVAELEDNDQSALKQVGLSGRDVIAITNELLSVKLKNNKKLMTRFIEKIVNFSIEGANRSMENNVKIHNLKLQDHYLEAIKLFKVQGQERVCQYKVKMSIKGLNEYIKHNEKLMPFFVHKELKTNKGTTVNLAQSEKSRWYIKHTNNKQIAKETVEINILMAFESEEQQRLFEKGFSSKGGLGQKSLKRITSNIIEANNATLDENDIKHLSKTLKRKKQLIEIFDKSSSCVLGSIGLYFQVTALKEAQKEIDNIKDPIAKILMKYRLLISYASTMSATTQLIIDGTQLLGVIRAQNASLFIERGGRLSALLEGLKPVANVANVLGVIDSAMSLTQAITSCIEGNTGSGVVCATSALSLIMGLAVCANIVPFWGQIIFIVISIGILIVNNIFYSDGSDWDEINKWLNRCMLGNFDFHQSKYPPYYLPTPKCMLLSEQDYYLAVNGGRCLLEAERSTLLEAADTILTNTPPMYPIGVAYKLIEIDYDLMLTLNLPDFDRDKSVFEGKVTIKSLSKSNQTPVELTISHGGESLAITPLSSADFFTPRTEEQAESEELYRMDEKKKKQSKDEKLLIEMMDITFDSKSDDNKSSDASTTDTPSDNKPIETPSDSKLIENQVGLFLIKWKLGKIKGKHEVSIRVNYWPTGMFEKSDNNKEKQEKTPFLLSYNYIKD